MRNHYLDIATTPAVHAARLEADGFDRYEGGDGEIVHALLGPAEAEFIALRDSFYIASVSETGWPYMQHRGGPAGFLRVLDERTLGFADFRGNKQYVTVGNTSVNDRVSLFLIDYPHRQRLKVYGRLSVVHDAAFAKRLQTPGYGGRAERYMRIDVEAFDWNCPQHITQRYTAAEVQVASAPLHARIAELETEVRRLTTSS